VPAEHTAFCVPLIPVPGNTVGVAATLTKSSVTCAAVAAGDTVKNGDPDTSVREPPLPMLRTDTDPGTRLPEASEVARLATNKNLPAASIDSASGTTSTDSVLSGGAAPVIRTVGAVKVSRLPTCDSVPSDLTWNVAIPVGGELAHKLLLIMITNAYEPPGCITIDPGRPFKMHCLFPVSLVELPIDDTCPLLRSKL